MKPDERALLAVCATGWPRDRLPPGMHYKRAWYILRKWSRLGLYDYGVSLDLGWLTNTGRALLK